MKRGGGWTRGVNETGWPTLGRAGEWYRFGLSFRLHADLRNSNRADSISAAVDSRASLTTDRGYSRSIGATCLRAMHRLGRPESGSPKSPRTSGRRGSGGK